MDVTLEDADAAGAGGRLGAGKSYRERVTGQQGNPEGKSSRVGEGEGGPKASGVAENPRGDRQG